MVAAVVLAAGASRRMGKPKLLLKHSGATLLATSIRRARQACERVVVVVGAHADEYRTEALREGAEVVVNADWQLGMAASIQRGVAHLGDAPSGALIVLPDQAFVSAKHLRELVGRHCASGAEATFSAYAGTIGAPAILGRTLYGQLARLKGDVGAKALAAAARTVAEVPLAAYLDVDTPEDAALLS